MNYWESRKNKWKELKMIFIPKIILKTVLILQNKISLQSQYKTLKKQNQVISKKSKLKVKIELIYTIKKTLLLLIQSIW